MRAPIKLLAGFCASFGAVLLVAGVAMLTIHMPALANLQIRVFGLLLYGAAGTWCLFVAIRFFRRPNSDHAIAVCKPAAVMLYLALVGLSIGVFDDAFGGSIVLPLIGVGAVYAFYFFILKPLARRAYPAGETDDREATTAAANECPRDDSIPAETKAGSTSPAVFVPTEGFFRQLRRGVLFGSIPACVLAIGLGVYLGAGDTPDWSLVIMVGVGGMIIMGTTMVLTFRRQRQSYETLRIELGGQAISRTQAGYPRLDIRYDEVARVVEVPGKGLLVIGPGKYGQMFLSKHLSDFDTLRARLAEMRPLEPGRSSWGVPSVTLLYGAGALVCMGVAFRAANPVLVTVAASLLIVALIGSVALLARNPHVDARMKKGLWTVAIVVVVLAMRIWSAWTLNQ